MSRDAVIVSTARTAIGRAYKGGFNDTSGPTLGSYSLKPAIERAGVEPDMIDDVVWGAALQQGTQAGNLARQVALRVGCPIGTSGMTVDRQCSSGLMAIATASMQVTLDRMDVVAAGGSEVAAAHPIKPAAASTNMPHTKAQCTQPKRRVVGNSSGGPAAEIRRRDSFDRVRPRRRSSSPNSRSRLAPR